MPERWSYTLKFRFTPQINALISASTTFELQTTQQLSVAQKAQVEAGDFEILSEEQTETA